MSDFPAAGYITDNARTEGEVKTALENWLAATKQGSGLPRSTLTIVGGLVTADRSSHAIDTEGAASTDDLTNIVQTNLPDGSLLFITPANDARTIVVKHSAGGAGQISLTYGTQFAMDRVGMWLLLQRVGTIWEEIGRMFGADLAAPVGTRMVFDQDAPPPFWTRDTTVNDRFVNIQGTGARVHGGAWVISGLTHPHDHSMQGHTHGATGAPSALTEVGSAGVSVASSVHTHATGGPSVANTGGASTVLVSADGLWRPLHRSMILASRDN